MVPLAPLASRRRFRLALLFLSTAASACTTAGGGGAAAAAGWEGLASPRPAPLAGAPRVALGDLAAPEASGATPALSSADGLLELVAAGLLRRRDVQFVERRRFSAAAERERRGIPPPAGAPPLGSSPGAQLVLSGSWLALGDSAFLALRLIDPATGVNRTAWRVGVPAGADPTSVARVVTGTLLATLNELGLLPASSEGAAPATYQPSGVPLVAAEAFVRGVQAEDRYDWETARVAYQRAKELGGPGFFEPDVALARAARLRGGGTLGAS